MYVGQEFTGKLENCGYTVEGMVVDGGYGNLENCRCCRRNCRYCMTVGGMVVGGWVGKANCLINTTSAGLLN